MTVFVGIDLAWSGRKPTGICVLDDGDGELRSQSVGTACWSPQEIVAWLQTLGPDVLAAIDAPLIVGEARRAEGLMAKAFPDTRLRAYSARPDFLSRHGITAGPELGVLLGESGWSLDPAQAHAPGRRALEVFPHAVIVALLGHPRLLQYKKGPIATRLAALTTFQGLLREHAAACLAVAAGCAAMSCIDRDASSCRGPALKSHEDELDAIACAFAAHHIATAGAAAMQVFGDVVHGYISVPVRAERSANTRGHIQECRPVGD